MGTPHGRGAGEDRVDLAKVLRGEVAVDGSGRAVELGRLALLEVGGPPVATERPGAERNGGDLGR